MYEKGLFGSQFQMFKSMTPVIFLASGEDPVLCNNMQSSRRGSKCVQRGGSTRQIEGHLIYLITIHHCNNPVL
jgi:hypothetical protein